MALKKRKKIKVLPNKMIDVLKKMKVIKLFNRFVGSIDLALDGQCCAFIQLKDYGKVVLLSKDGKDYLDIYYYNGETDNAVIERAILAEKSRE